MRILHIMQCANLGGMEQTTLLRIIELMKRGNTCELISLNRVAGLRPQLEAAGVPFAGLTYRSPWGIPSFPEMYAAFRRAHCDAIMMTGHNLAAMMALGNLCKDRRMLCIHFHHRGVKHRVSWKVIYRVAMNIFPVITFPTAFIKAEAEDIFPPLKAVASVLPNPFVVPPSKVTEKDRWEARAELGLAQDAFVVGNAGWLIPRKRWDVFLSVAAAVLKRSPTAIFVIAGDGPERSRLEALAETLGLRDRVLWMGWTDRMGSFYSALNVLLFNSDWDALGRTPVEAAACGIPVVASIVHGGLSEVLRDGVDAFVFDSHDVERLCGRILDLRDEQLVSKMVESARNHIAATYSVEGDVSTLSKLLGVS